MSTILEVVYQPLGTLELGVASIGPKGDKGDVGDVNPEMYTILANAEDARDAAASSATDAANDALATASDRVQTGLDKTATAVDLVQTGLDKAATAADRVQTGLDKTATAADRVQTGLDKTATAADRVQTGFDADATAADVIATAADRVQTGLDRVATAADRVQTGLDRVATGADAVATAADRVQTGLDKTATAADRVQTGLDKTATASDRVQTGLDKTATAADRVQTGLDAATATTKAGEASTSASAAAESANTASAKAAQASEFADTALAKSIIATDAANNASAAVVSQLQAIKSQTETARDQALAGLGAADNSQVLSELLGTITYALDLAGQAAKEMPSLAALFPAIDSIGKHIVAMMDLLGVTARTVAGGDVLLGPGLVGAPSLAAFGDRNTGIYFPTADQLAIVTGGIQRLLVDASGNHATGTDNAQSLGTASKRWSTVYAGTGTINTSDAREKTAVTPLSVAELAAASAMAKEIGSYQFLASIADKGDAARHHIGLTVQRAIEILEGNGLNPFKFGFICHDTWPKIAIEHPATEAVDDELDEEGNVVRPGTPAKDATTEIVQAAGDRYAFRYDQLALFIAAGFEARLSALETA